MVIDGGLVLVMMMIVMVMPYSLKLCWSATIPKRLSVSMVRRRLVFIVIVDLFGIFLLLRWRRRWFPRVSKVADEKIGGKRYRKILRVMLEESALGKDTY